MQRCRDCKWWHRFPAVIWSHFLSTSSFIPQGLSIGHTVKLHIQSLRTATPWPKYRGLNIQIDNNQSRYKTSTHSLQQPLQETNPLFYKEQPGGQHSIRQTCRQPNCYLQWQSGKLNKICYHGHKWPGCDLLLTASLIAVPTWNLGPTRETSLHPPTYHTGHLVSSPPASSCATRKQHIQSLPLSVCLWVCQSPGDSGWLPS